MNVVEYEHGIHTNECKNTNERRQGGARRRNRDEREGIGNSMCECGPSAKLNIIVLSMY